MRSLIATDQDRNTFIQKIMQIPLDGKRRWTAEFKPFRIQRTIKQNSLYRVWLRCIAAETGNDINDLDECFKQKHLSWQVKEVLGDTVVRRIHTSTLNTAEFTVYLEAVKMQMLVNYGIELKSPGEDHWDDFYSHYGQER